MWTIRTGPNLVPRPLCALIAYAKKLEGSGYGIASATEEAGWIVHESFGCFLVHLNVFKFILIEQHKCTDKS